MPVDPRGEWCSDPFEPVVRDGRIWGRGADDDKGQLWMHAKAFEAMCATGTLPCNVKFMLEGEEEIGSPSLYGFCRQYKKLLKADVILVSDTSMLSMQTPSITCGLRGLAYMEVEVGCFRTINGLCRGIFQNGQTFHPVHIKVHDFLERRINQHAHNQSYIR